MDFINPIFSLVSFARKAIIGRLRPYRRVHGLGALDLPLKISDMARKAEKEKTRDGLKLKIVNPNAAGIDIAYGEMQVCVPEDRDSDNNRCFGSFTCNYEEIASWLKACNITTVAMESTGSYWVGIYFSLKREDLMCSLPMRGM